MSISVDFSELTVESQNLDMQNSLLSDQVDTGMMKNCLLTLLLEFHLFTARFALELVILRVIHGSG